MIKTLKLSLSLDGLVQTSSVNQYFFCIKVILFIIIGSLHQFIVNCLMSKDP